VCHVAKKSLGSDNLTIPLTTIVAILLAVILGNWSIKSMFKKPFSVQAILVGIGAIVGVICPIKCKAFVVEIPIVIPILVVKFGTFIQIGQIPLSSIMTIGMLATYWLGRNPAIGVFLFVLLIVPPVVIDIPAVALIMPELITGCNFCMLGARHMMALVMLSGVCFVDTMVQSYLGVTVHVFVLSKRMESTLDGS